MTPAFRYGGEGFTKFALLPSGNGVAAFEKYSSNNTNTAFVAVTSSTDKTSRRFQTYASLSQLLSLRLNRYCQSDNMWGLGSGSTLTRVFGTDPQHLWSTKMRNSVVPSQDNRAVIAISDNAWIYTPGDDNECHPLAALFKPQQNSACLEFGRVVNLSKPVEVPEKAFVTLPMALTSSPLVRFQTLDSKLLVASTVSADNTRLGVTSLPWYTEVDMKTRARVVRDCIDTAEPMTVFNMGRPILAMDVSEHLIAVLTNVQLSFFVVDKGCTRGSVVVKHTFSLEFGHNPCMRAVDVAIVKYKDLVEARTGNCTGVMLLVNHQEETYLTPSSTVLEIELPFPLPF